MSLQEITPAPILRPAAVPARVPRKTRLHAQGLAPTFQTALLRLIDAPTGFVLCQGWFRDPDDLTITGVSSDTARRMHRVALVRLFSTISDTRVQLTERGRTMALALQASQACGRSADRPRPDATQDAGAGNGGTR